MKKYILPGITALMLSVAVILGVIYFTGKPEKAGTDPDAKISASGSETGQKKAPIPDIPVNFKELQSINPDVYAYIEIPETAISYPILQSADGSVDYLNTTLEKTPGLPGCIYTENIHSQDFREANTLVYGHDMNDGTMFSGLHGYDDEAFFKEHPVINIYLPEEAIQYRVYAAVVFDDRYLPTSYNFDTLDGKAQFLEDIHQYNQQPAHFNEEFAPAAEDSLITLSTCIADKPSNRWLIIGVRDKGENR